MSYMRVALVAAMISLAAAGNALARPVTYPGGWSVMTMNDEAMNALHTHYTITPQFSLGYKGEYMRDEEWQFHGAQLVWLVKRWNRPASQANFYFKAAGGFAYSDYGLFRRKIEPAGFGGLAVDWEDRRFFVSYANEAYYAGDLDQFFMQRGRVGIAPYIGDYGDVHTWIMVEVQHRPFRRTEELSIVPLVRVFWKDYLFEAGASHRGDFLINAMIVF